MVKLKFLFTESTIYLLYVKSNVKILSASNPKAMRSINEAFAEYRKYTCITFRKRTNEREYVKFYKGGG